MCALACATSALSALISKWPWCEYSRDDVLEVAIRRWMHLPVHSKWVLCMCDDPNGQLGYPPVYGRTQHNVSTITTQKCMWIELQWTGSLVLAQGYKFSENSLIWGFLVWFQVFLPCTKVWKPQNCVLFFVLFSIFRLYVKDSLTFLGDAILLSLHRYTGYPWKNYILHFNFFDWTAKLCLGCWLH